jgi:hypothetical protein
MPADAAATHGCGGQWHDLEIHILGHALDDLVRACECGAAAENELERACVDRGECRYGAYDEKILFDEGDTRQAKERLDFAERALLITAQGAIPCPDISGDATSGSCVDVQRD